MNLHEKLSNQSIMNNFSSILIKSKLIKTSINLYVNIIQQLIVPNCELKHNRSILITAALYISLVEPYYEWYLQIVDGIWCSSFDQQLLQVFNQFKCSSMVDIYFFHQIPSDKYWIVQRVDVQHCRTMNPFHLAAFILSKLQLQWNKYWSSIRVHESIVNEISELIL